jgi:sugar lactone lactonase YvrE
MPSSFHHKMETKIAEGPTTDPATGTLFFANLHGMTT